MNAETEDPQQETELPSAGEHGESGENEVGGEENEPETSSSFRADYLVSLLVDRVYSDRTNSRCTHSLGL